MEFWGDKPDNKRNQDQSVFVNEDQGAGINSV